MSIADEIIAGNMPNFDQYLAQGNSLEDVDEYGFTLLIECAITKQFAIAEQLIKLGADVNKPDVTGRTPLHWAVDNNDLEMSRLLLANGANPNAFTSAGLSVLVYPILRGHHALKHLLYQYDAKLDFALDFILGKLIGHRFELEGDVDIVNAEGEFIELNYEGFILEFTVAIIRDSLRRFTSSYSTRDLRYYFPKLHSVTDAFEIADQMLLLQQHLKLSQAQLQQLEHWLNNPLLFLPVASTGHALSFIRYRSVLAKIDRGENSLKEGSVNIYHMTKPEAFSVNFLQEFLYSKQPRHYYHEVIVHKLGLVPVAKIPMTSQITGNCSWANIQAVVPIACILESMQDSEAFDSKEALEIYDRWIEWDKDRALDEAINRFYLANPVRKASIAAMLGAILFQSCNHANSNHIKRAEKILTILTLPEYYYVLKTYLEINCVKRLTLKGNNLLKILDDCGINSEISVTPIATQLAERELK